jgi:hypothetical protein
MVTKTNASWRPVELNGQRSDVNQIRTARIYSRPYKLLEALDRLLFDVLEHDTTDDLRDLARRIGR